MKKDWIKLVEDNFLSLDLLCICFWNLVTSIYFFRLLNRHWYQYTAYGKLDEEEDEKESKIFKKFGILNFGVTSRTHFITMYFFGMVFNTYFNLIHSISFLTILYQFHLMRRFIESLFLTNFSTRIVRFPLFIFGISFYFFTTLSFFTLKKEMFQVSIFHVFISILFLSLNFYQMYHHFILKSLKKYSIPFGGLFTFITCPHYFIEILIYFSLSLLMSFQDSNIFLIISLNIFVILNLTLNSFKTHQVRISIGLIIPVVFKKIWIKIFNFKKKINYSIFILNKSF
jgi:3-oxo-5-alpha-steroid 4-dehydrogenase 3 / polyprenol reductase